MSSEHLTAEQREFFTSRGWVVADPNGFYSLSCAVSAAENLHMFRMGSRQNPQRYLWYATRSRTNSDETGTYIVVRQEDACTDPIACFVLAELRQWRNP